jgi:hypothetical protein
MKRVYFFSTPGDAATLLSAFDRVLPVQYVSHGTLQLPAPKVYTCADQIPSLGISSAETGSQSDQYLVLLRDSAFKVENFRDAEGIERLAIYNGSNEGSAVLTVAGQWGNDVLLAGNFSTMHADAVSRKLLRTFAATIKKIGFVKASLWWVGSEAFEMLKVGKRLATLAVQSPPEYDLPLPDELRSDRASN